MPIALAVLELAQAAFQNLDIGTMLGYPRLTGITGIQVLTNRTFFEPTHGVEFNCVFVDGTTLGLGTLAMFHCSRLRLRFVWDG